MGIFGKLFGNKRPDSLDSLVDSIVVPEKEIIERFKTTKRKTDQDIDNLFASSSFVQRYISIPFENKMAFLQEFSDIEIDGYLKEGKEVNKTKPSHMSAGNFQMYLFRIARTQMKKKP